MKIGIDINALKDVRTGVGRYVINLVENIIRLDQRDEFMLYSPRPDYVPRLSKNVGIRGAMSLRFLPGTLWLQTEGLKLVKSDKVDCYWGTQYVLPFGLPRETRTVLTVHDMVFYLYPSMMSRYNHLVSSLYFLHSIKKASRIITLSNDTKSRIASLLSIPGDRISVIRLGVDKSFCPMNQDFARAKIKNKYGITKRMILSVGTIEPRKNYDTLIRAFRAAQLGEHELVIVGRPGWQCRSTLREIAAAENVSALGFVQEGDLPFFYAAAEVFVLPSLYEGFGLPLLEAMSCGSPAICSTTSSLPEIGGNAVLYFDPTSVKELCEQLTHLTRNRALKGEMKERGLKRATAFSWHRAAVETLQVLREAAE